MKISKNFYFLLIGFFGIITLVGIYLLSRPVNSAKTVNAPDFSYTLLNGKNAKLSDYLGKKPIVLNFWSPW